MNTLKQRIQEDMKAALRAKDAQRLSVIRMILAAVTQVEVDERLEVDDERLLQILAGIRHQGYEALAQYQQAARHNLLEQARFELQVVEAYLGTAY